MRTANSIGMTPIRAAIFPLDTIRPNARLLRQVRAAGYEITMDKAFAAVITACADRDETWIDPRIKASYQALHKAGFAHSVESLARRGTRWRDLWGRLEGRVLRRKHVQSCGPCEQSRLPALGPPLEGERLCALRFAIHQPLHTATGCGGGAAQRIQDPVGPRLVGYAKGADLRAMILFRLLSSAFC